MRLLVPRNLVNKAPQPSAVGGAVVPVDSDVGFTGGHETAFPNHERDALH
jgi:hypothetical protein